MTSGQPFRAYAMGERFASNVRIWDSTHPVGMGFLIDSRHIMTCAHVVGDALGDSGKGKALIAPSGAVRFDFVCNKAKTAGDTHKATVVPDSWRPEEGDRIPADVAVLEIDGAVALPPGAALIRSCLGTDTDDRFSGFGIKENLPEGTYINGRFAGKLSADRIEVVADDLFVAIDGGCSGAAVWNLSRGGVAGMVVEKHTDLQGRVIPIESLGTVWPAIMPEGAAAAGITVGNLRWRKLLDDKLHTFDRKRQTADFGLALDDFWDAKRSPVVCGILGTGDDRPMLCRDRCLKVPLRERLERLELGGDPVQREIEWPDPGDRGVGHAIASLKQQVRDELKARDASAVEIRKAYNAGVAPFAFFSVLNETEFTSLHQEMLLGWIGFWRDVGAEALNKPLAVLLIFQLENTPREGASLEQVFKSFGQAPFDYINRLARLHNFSRQEVIDWLTNELRISSDDLKDNAMKNLGETGLRMAMLHDWVLNLQI